MAGSFWTGLTTWSNSMPPSKIDGDTITITVDTVTSQQGRGETWRFKWSVFRDTLTLSRFPGEGLQAGPTFFISQPFIQM